MSSPPVSPSRETAAPAPPDVEVRCVGLATRVISFVVDAALINLVAVIVGAGAALILSLVHLPKSLDPVLAAIGGLVYIAWTIGYFVTFWSTTGQTPGARMMQIRVVTAGGRRVHWVQSVVRCAGMFLAALRLFAGYVPILFDRRRRAFQDWLAHTLVIEAPQESLAEVRQAKNRAAYLAARQASPGAPGPRGGGSEPVG
jgi:uncharacterized RDD family membrane protein YckC